MAEAVLDRLEEEVKCSICLERYTDPKTLQCNHIFCHQCLASLVGKGKHGQPSINCPTCHRTTNLTRKGVAGLQSALYLDPLLKRLAEYRKTKENSQGASLGAQAQRDTTSQSPKAEVEASGGSDSSSKDKAQSDETATEHPEDAVKSKPRDGRVGLPELPNQKAMKKKKGNKITSQSQQGAKANGKNLEFCSVHPNKDLELFCETCEELICTKCVLKSGKHFKHKYQEVSVAYDKFKQEMMSLLEPTERHIERTSKALEDVNARSEAIAKQGATIQAEIETSVNELHRVLEERQRELLGQLYKMAEDKLQSLDAQRKRMEDTQAQLQDCLDFVRQNPEGDQAQVLMRIPPDVLQIKAEADLAFSIPKDLDNVLQNYMELSVADPVDASKCLVTGESLETGVVGEKSTILLQAVGSDGKPCELKIKHWVCELVSEITKTTIKLSPERTGPSQYEISYQPTVKGRHFLHIKISGQHVRGSPFSMIVKFPLEMFGTPFWVLDGVKSPTGIVVNQKGEVLLTEGNGHCVTVFSPSGKKLRSIGAQGCENGQFRHPCGVAVDLEGNIFVADTDNNRIQKLTADGKFLALACGSGSPKFTRPRGIAFNPTNNRLYIVDAKDRILVVNSDLTFHSSFGEKGTKSSEFDQPSDVACDTAGNVYVTDSKNNRIQVFTADLKFLRAIGPECGEGKTDLKTPLSIAVDTSAMVYVSGFGNQVSLFNSEGQLVNSFACPMVKGASISTTSGLAVDPTGVVYVCDSHRSLVTLY